MATSSQTFCVLPWVHQFVSERGRLFPCAFSMEAGQALADAEGRFYSVEEADVAWNAPAMRNLRRDLLTGTAPQSCSRCFRLEELEIQSLREIANRHFGHLANECIQSTNSDGSAPRNVVAMDLRFGNACNLRCRMCSPESSVKLIGEFRELYPGLSESYFSELQNLDWFRSKSSREKLLEHAASLRELHFAGGEPFLIPEVAEFLHEFVATGEAKHVTLTFNTNLTLLPESIYSLWPHFEKVKVFVSLDGAGPVNDYIRFPSKFAMIDKNLRFLDENFSELSCSLVCFNSTIQMYNVLNLPELIDYTTLSFKNFLPFPILSPLFWPEPFCIDVLPKHLKEETAGRLNAFSDKHAALWKTMDAKCDFPNGAHRFQRNIVGIIRLMQERDRSALLPEFFRLTAELDRKREQSLATVQPQLNAMS